jgi:hypothetical protein
MGNKTDSFEKPPTKHLCQTATRIHQQFGVKKFWSFSTRRLFWVGHPQKRPKHPEGRSIGIDIVLHSHPGTVPFAKLT